MAVLLGLTFILAGLWIAAAKIWPYTRCRRCKGAGRFRSPGRRNWRNCPRCTGSGRRTRPLAPKRLRDRR